MSLAGMVLGEQSTQFDGETLYVNGIALDILALENVVSELAGGTFGELRKTLLRRAAAANRPRR